MNLYVYTLGCRVNQCESEAIAQAFLNAGHDVLKSSDGAHLVIVNSCTVTSKAEQKARRMIRLFAKNSLVLVTGCYAQVNKEEILGLSDNVFVLPLTRKQELLRFPYSLAPGSPAISLRESLSLLCSVQTVSGSVFDYAATDFSYHCRSYLKIQDGCDNNCGYCLTHIARGPSQFLDHATVIERALEIERKGYHEIVLTGVNLDNYDNKGEGLGGLLKKLLKALGPDIRLRLSSLEPDHIDDLLIEQLADYRIQPYFHIPIQSASDKVIQRVNRHYDHEHLEKAIGKIRSIKDDPFLACDVITGLPGEDEEDFKITEKFLTDFGFSKFHVFPFSPRPATALYKAKDKVPESIRDARAEILRNLSEQQTLKYIERQIGKEHEAILEEHKNKTWYGLTGNYLKVRIDGVKQDAHCGDLVKLTLTSGDRGILL